MEDDQRYSLPSEHFEAIYRRTPDPWKYETSSYEQIKYEDTLKSLPQEYYQNALEIGCSVGILTEQLSLRCTQLLAVDCSSLALQQARKRCAKRPQVLFQQMNIPSEFPSGFFDLILLSEVGYYWSIDDLHLAREYIVNHLELGGHLMLVHWTLHSKDHRISGDVVHEVFLRIPPSQLAWVAGKCVESHQQRYRIDIFKKSLGVQ